MDILKISKILQNLKKLPDFRVKIFKTSNPSARLEKLHWPVMIVKLRKGQIYSKTLKTIANFKTLLKFKILKSPKPFHRLRRLSIIPIAIFKQNHWLIKILKLGTR